MSKALNINMDNLVDLEKQRNMILNIISNKYPAFEAWNKNSRLDNYKLALESGVFGSQEWKLLISLNNKINNIKDSLKCIKAI